MTTLERFRSELKHETRVKILESKVLNAVYTISNANQKCDSLAVMADAAAWCIENSKDEMDELDKHWRQQCLLYRQQKNLTGYNFNSILCLVKGLPKSDLVLLEKIVIEMGQSIPQIENNPTTDDIHEMVMGHIINSKESIEIMNLQLDTKFHWMKLMQKQDNMK
jgi:hypothetical protein